MPSKQLLWRLRRWYCVSPDTPSQQTLPPETYEWSVGVVHRKWDVPKDRLGTSKDDSVPTLADMRSFLFIGLWLLALSTNAQVASDYYGNPVDTSLYSLALAQTRQLTVILPTTFNPKRKTKYPLILVFDRQNKAIFRQLFESINYLNRFDEIPEAVIVGLTTDPQQRNLETSLPAQNSKAEGEQLIQFVFDQLVPWLETTYHTGACRILVGHSRFGYFTTAMMCRRADQLSGVISLSPFFKEAGENWVDSVATRFSAERPLAHPLFYRFITGDSLTDTPDYGLMKAKLSQARLQSSFDWQGYAFYQAKHMVVPGLGVMPSLLDIFHSWSATADSLSFYWKSAQRPSYADFKRRMQGVYGQEIGLGLARLNGLGSGYNTEKQYDQARVYWQQVVEDYPFYTPVYIDMAETYLAQHQSKEAARYLRQGLVSLESNHFLPVATQALLRKQLRQKLDRLSP